LAIKARSSKEKKPEMAFRVFLFLFSCLKIRENEGSDQQTMMAAAAAAACFAARVSNGFEP
jgi:hypothetical protein